METYNVICHGEVQNAVYILLTDESVLMDLKALLVEAKQKVPPVLQVLQTGDETMLDIGGEKLSFSLCPFTLVISSHWQKQVCLVSKRV